MFPGEMGGKLSRTSAEERCMGDIRKTNIKSRRIDIGIIIVY